MIEGKRILTNAHVVLYASQMQIQANQAGDKISAKVESVAPGIDLAVLKLDDETFFDSHPPLPRATTMPSVKDPVMAYGYPDRRHQSLDHQGHRFAHRVCRVQLPGVRACASRSTPPSIPATAAGPAVVGDQMIGLAFSRLDNAREHRLHHPCEEIDLFLKDVADGHYDGKPGIYDELQTLENPALRAFLKLDPSRAGHGRAQPLQGLMRLSAQGVGCDHQDRRHAGG